MGWISSFSLMNSYVLFSSLCVELYSQYLGNTFHILNMYGPYEEREAFWDDLLSKSWLEMDKFILVGDLNFTLNVGEV